LAISSIVLAQGNGFTETFDDPELSGWEHTPGVEVRNGILSIPSESFVAAPGLWGNMELSVFLRRIEEGDFVISYGNHEGEAYHLLQSAARITLQHESAGVLEEMAATEMEFIPAGEWFQLNIQIMDKQHSVFINGNPLLNGEFPAQAFGGISFETFAETGIEIDSVELVGDGQVVEDGNAAEEAESPHQQAETETDADLPATPWVYTGGPSGGLGYDIRMDPRNPDVLYVTDAWAGAFKSTDGGANWSPINNGITARVGPSGDGIPVFSLTVDQNNPDTLWAGTQFGGGVFRSDNGGENWRSMSNGIQEQSLTIRGFTVEPGNSNVVYLAGEVASWEWNGTPLNGIGFDLTKGAIYKTTDGGANWTRIWYGDNLARYIWIHPSDHNRIYASTGIFDREAANSNPDALEPGGVGILRSRDGGASWEELGVANGIRSDELFFGSLAMNPENPDILIGAAGNDAYLWALNNDMGAIYRTKDGGDSWERVLGLPNASALEMCEKAPAVIYAASVSGFFRSDDGGDSWEKQGGSDDPLGQTGAALWGPEDIVAGFPIDMQCDPRDSMHIFVNNYGGGNFLSEDGGKTWVDASKGYTGALMHQIVVANDDPALVYASARSGVFISSNGGNTWEGMSRGVVRAMEGYAIAVNPQDSSHIVTVVGDAGPVPKISYDRGQTWQEAELAFGNDGFHEWGLMQNMIFSPTQPDRMIGVNAQRNCEISGDCAAGQGVIFSDDGGKSWKRSNLQQGMGMEVIYSPNGNAYAVIYPSDLYYSIDGGENWELVAQNIGSGINLQDADPDMGGAVLAALAVDPQNKNRLYAGFLRGGMMISEDAGRTWKAASSGMIPETSIFDLVADPAHPGVIYAASNDSGVYISTNSGASWMTINEGLLTRAGVSLALSTDGNVLYLATTGGGVFRLGTPANTSTPDQTQPGLDTVPNSTPEDKQPPAIPCLGGMLPMSRSTSRRE